MSGVEAEDAKKEVAECEKEIGTIKALLRGLGPAAEDESESNEFKVAFLKVEGLPEEAKPVLKLQISSPVEEATLSEIFDPLAEDTSKMMAVFRAVETNQATMSIEASDADIPLGNAEEVYDLGPLTKFDGMDPKKEYVNELSVKIVPEDGEVAICTVQLRVTYVPSNKDKREELYEQLNKTSQRKAQAVNKLRQVALAASRDAPAGSAGQNKKPAVKPGFLNKPNKEPTKMEAWYNRTLGPDSLLRKLFPVAKNYVLFFGIVGVFHFKGQALALPPPV
jgi:hypothetical protein